MTEPTRWGISSTGRIAASFVEGLHALDDAVIVAVASRTADAAAAFADEHDIPRRHVGPAAMAADPDLDAVYVASPHPMHHPDVLTYVNAGKAVLCEKPFAVNEAQGMEMTQTATANGVLLMEALWSRFLPSYLRLQELLETGRIGEPRYVEANFAFRLPDDAAVGHRLTDPDLAGGAVLDLGIYTVQLAHLVFGGEPADIVALGDVRGGIDEQTGMVAQWADGQLATMFAAVRTAGTNTARISGTEGAIELDAFMHRPERLTVTDTRGNTEVFDEPLTIPGLAYQAVHFQQCLRDGLLQSPVMPHAETHALLRTLDRVRAAIDLRYPFE